MPLATDPFSAGELPALAGAVRGSSKYGFKRRSTEAGSGLLFYVHNARVFWN